MLTLAVVAGVVCAAGAAGLVRDRVRARRRPEPPNGAGAADPTLRYHRDVGQSSNEHGIFGGPMP